MDVSKEQPKVTAGLDLGDRYWAVVAVARKLAVLLHSLWVTGEVYDPLHNTHRRQEREKAA